MTPATRIDRKVRREVKVLVRETRKALRRHGHRVPEEVGRELARRADGLEIAYSEDDRDQMRIGLIKLDDLSDEYLAFARKSTAREYAESIGIAVLIALLLRAFVVEAFKIPSGSMIPTLEIGDHIFVNKFLYGIRIPYTDTKLFQWRSPRRSEVIVFVYPCDNDKDFIKRIVAVAGDTVEVRCNILYINGKPVPIKLQNAAAEYWDVDDDEVRAGPHVTLFVGVRERVDLAIPGGRAVGCDQDEHVGRSLIVVRGFGSNFGARPADPNVVCGGHLGEELR